MIDFQRLAGGAAQPGYDFSAMPEFEKQPKSTVQLLVEGCLILILCCIALAAICTVVIRILNKALYE
jgi:hypothetical protein